MSDPDAMPDPIDKAYVEAEAVLSDEAAREARRVRVLAAVAGQDAPDVPAARPRPWRRSGWLVAASVAGLALFVATQVYRPPSVYTPPVKPVAAPVAPAPTSNTATTAPTPPAPAPRVATQAPVLSAGAPVRGAQTETPPVVAAQAPPPAFPSTTEPAPSVAAAPPPPPAPAPAPVVDAARDEAPKAQAASRAPADNADNAAAVSEMVVTGEKPQSRRQSAPAAVSAFSGRFREAGDAGERLRAAAVAGRIKDLKVLLEQGAPVDSADPDGNTALMKSIQADRPAAAALLRQHGADLDHKNHAGESAIDMARAKRDPELNQAVGLGP